MKKITLTGINGETFQLDPSKISYVLAGGIVRGPRKMYAVTADSVRLAQEAICCWNLEDYPAGTTIKTWGEQVTLRKQSDGLFAISLTGRKLTAKEVVDAYGVALFSIAPPAAAACHEKYTEILQHRIEWFLRGDNAPEELDGCSVEHIEKCIKEGYNQGELCVLGDDGDTEYRGWWSIKTVQ